MWTKRLFNPNFPPILIAELSGNHNNCYETAVKLIKQAASVGADAVKLQTFTADTITVNSNDPRYRVDSKKWGFNTLYDLYDHLAMPWEWQGKLCKLAKSLNMGFLSTPFDNSAVEFLVDIGVDALKIASPEVVDLPLIKKSVQTGLPVIISTGGATEADIKLICDNLSKSELDNICFLHCIAEYPSSTTNANLSTMVELEKLSKTRVGLSDHSIGWELSFSAVALGARVVEKHIVLSRSDGGTDSYFSSEPAELKSVREAMDLSFSILGRNLLDGRLNEEIDVQNSRRSLVALKSIKSGEMVTEFNIGSRRPGGGLAPIFYNEVMRRTAKVDIQKGAPIQLDDLD